LPEARNTGARQTASDYLIFLDADDTLEPVAMTALVYALEKNRDAAFVYPFQHYFGDYDQVLMTQDYNAYDLLWANHPSVCALMRREAWERAGGYKPALRSGYEDWEFWIALAEQGMHGICLPAPVFNYRRHGESMVHAASEKHRAICRQILELHAAWYRPESVSALKRRWHPLVTVVTPADAAPAPMGRTLESLAAQTLGDFEILMLGTGDGQTATHLAAERLGGRVETRVLGVNHEVVNWRTVAAGFARADFLCFLEGGETLRPTELEEMVWREIYQMEFGLKSEEAAPARRLAAREVPEGSPGNRGNNRLHKDPLALDLRNRYARDLSLIRHISHRTNIMPNPMPAAAWQSGKAHLLLVAQDLGAPAARGLAQAVLRALPRERYHWTVVAEKPCAAKVLHELGGLADEIFCTANFIPAEQPIDRFLESLLASRNVALAFGCASPTAARCMSAWRERYPELRLADLVDEATLRAEGVNRLADLQPILDLRVLGSADLLARLAPEETGAETCLVLDPAAGRQGESLLELRVKRLATSGDAARRLRDFELEIMAPQ
jgi:glycosyltransferase involved in cell wall biosynthesis